MAFRVMGCSPGSFFPKGMRPFSAGERRFGTYLAVGAAVAVGTLKVVSYIMRQKRRERWAKVGKDKVVLHMFPRGRVCPNLSPFVLKLEMYLRMAKIPYEVDFEEPIGPKGKSPWITLNGEEIGDSQLIMERLGPMFNKDFSSHLSAQDKAVAVSMRVLAEDHFLWCLAIWRYVMDNSELFMKNMEWPFIFKLIKHTFKGRVKKMTFMQGMGRHSDKEVVEFGRKDLQVLSTWLGDKPYFMGDKATEVDCAIFGILSQVEWCSQGSPYVSMIKGDYKNLSSYCYRIKEEFWPDWNQCLSPPLA